MKSFKKLVSIALMVALIIACVPVGMSSEASAYGVDTSKVIWDEPDIPKFSAKVTKDGALKVTIQKTKYAKGYQVMCVEGIGTRYEGYNTLYKNADNYQLVRIGRLLARVEQDGTKKRTVTIKNLAPGTYKIAVNAYSKYYVYFGDVMPEFTEEDGHEDYGKLSVVKTITIPDYGTDGMGYETSYDFSSLNVQDTFYFGSYEQDANFLNGSEPLEWRVLKKTDSEMLVLSEKVIDAVPYDKDDRDVTWQTCTLRKWLNKNFYDIAFNSAEKELIKTTKLKNQDHPEKEGKGGKDTKDKIFLLSYDDATNTEYFETFWDLRGRATEYTKYMGYVEPNGLTDWWLRTVGEQNDKAMKVYFSGNIYTNGIYVEANDNEVRPAMVIKLK